MASGYYNVMDKKWVWEPVKWEKNENGVYSSNRIIPKLFFRQKWPRDRRRTAGVILVRQNIKGLPDIWLVECYMSGRFGFPKGQCEQHESFRQTAQREFYEETGSYIKIPERCPTIKIEKEGSSTLIFFIVYVPYNFDIKTFPISDVEITKFGWFNLGQLCNRNNCRNWMLTATTNNVLMNKVI